MAELSSAPIFRSRRLGHVNLFVDDLERSTRFYHEVCGLEIEFTETGLKAQFMGTGHTPHDLGMIETTKGVDRYGKDGHLQIPGTVGRVVALNHLAWEMETEAELVDGIGRCAEAGVKISRLADHQIAHSAYLLDPEGNPLEFYVDTVRDWRRVLRGDVDLITSVWNPAAAKPSHERVYATDPQLDYVESAPLHPARLTHVTLVSADAPALADFYEKIGGLRIVHRNGRHAFLRGSHSGYRYHLAIIDQPGATGMHHFSFELPAGTDLNAIADRLSSQGVAIERRWDGRHKSSLFLIDPDGMRAEFFIPGTAEFPDLSKGDPAYQA
jgi:catechol 2,3-dioxygenase